MPCTVHIVRYHHTQQIKPIEQKRKKKEKNPQNHNNPIEFISKNSPLISFCYFVYRMCLDEKEKANCCHYQAKQCFYTLVLIDWFNKHGTLNRFQNHPTPMYENEEKRKKIVFRLMVFFFFCCSEIWRREH